MRLLITGGCGFLGSNIAARALSLGYQLMIFDNLKRNGAVENLSWLRNQGDFEFFHGDVRSPEDVTKAFEQFKPEQVFHLAGQVAMTTSIDRPRLDFEINALGTLNVLEAIRNKFPNTVIIYSSTNKVYGDLQYISYRETALRYETPDFPQGLPESLQLDFHSPYGCSKGSADQYILDYSRIYNINGIVFRHSSMYGGRQFATIDQGWVGWFCQKALEQSRGLREPFTVSGNGKQVRDLLHADDMVDLYFLASRNTERMAGKAFNIGGGPRNSLSILELLDFLEKETGTKLSYAHLPARESDQKVFIADHRKASSTLGWEPKVGWQEGIMKMLRWLKG